jgi:O-antigen/teichoic acid export membrane protein
LNPLRKLAGQTAIYGVSTITARLLNYFLVPLHTRIFAPASYGIVGEMYAYVSLLIVVLMYGMETAFFRFHQSEKNKEGVYSTTMISLLITSALFVLLAVIFAAPIAESIRYPGRGEYVVWFALIVAFDALSSIPFARLRALNKAGRFAFIKLLNIGINVILNLFFLLLCPYLLKKGIATEAVNLVYKPETGVGYIFISNLIASGFTWLILFAGFLKSKISFQPGLWRRMMKYALPLLIFGLAGMVNETMDRIFLKFLSPADIAQEQVGIYTACYKISIMMTIMIQAFKYAAEPFFFSHARENNAGSIYAGLMNYFIIACSAIFLVIMLYIDFVKYFIDAAYFEGLVIVPILLMANMFLGIFYNLSIWYKLTDKTHFGAWLAIFGAILTVILNLLLIPVLGYLGSAWATFFCYFAMMVVSYLIGQKHYPVAYNLKKAFLYILLAPAIYFLSILPDWPVIGLKYFTNSLLLTGFLLIVYKTEKPDLKSFIIKIKRFKPGKKS